VQELMVAPPPDLQVVRSPCLNDRPCIRERRALALNFGSSRRIGPRKRPETHALPNRSSHDKSKYFRWL
jgi:hypothetical protein